MNDIRPILYGVSDYALMRKTNAWFIDRTAKIREWAGLTLTFVSLMFN